MTQPYGYDGTSTFYDESAPSQYPDNFLPFDAGYNAYRPVGSAWPSANECATPTMPPFYEEMSFPVQQTHLHPAPAQAPMPPQNVMPVSIGHYGPWNGYPIAFEAPQILPYYPKSAIHQTQSVEYSPVSDADTVPSLPPKGSVVAVVWMNNDSVAPMKEEPHLVKKRKATSIAPAFERNIQDVKATTPSNPQQIASPRSLEDCMGLFDTTLTATKEKRRRKVFSAQEKKVVKSVRTVGACIQCKFRKKTVSQYRSCRERSTNNTGALVQCR